MREPVGQLVTSSGRKRRKNDDENVNVGERRGESDLTAPIREEGEVKDYGSFGDGNKRFHRDETRAGGPIEVASSSSSSDDERWP
jgi:hypothetical protein